MTLPTKINERISKKIKVFQDVLQKAKDADRNESDTVSIIMDILAEIFGYDKYSEITSELSIRGTYCDLAIKIDGKVQYLIECKSIGTELKENHLRQALDYGAKSGIPWVVLTNGISWQVHKIRFEQPVDHDLVCSFNLQEINYKKEEDQNKLFILCKEGLSRDCREDYYEKMQCLNRFIIGALIVSEPVVNSVRKELRKFAEGLKVENEEIEKIIKLEVLKRDIMEGEDATKAQNKVKRFYKKQLKNKEKETETPTEKVEQTAPTSTPDTNANN